MKNILKYWGYGVLALGLFFGRYIGKWIVNVIDNKDTRVNNGRAYTQKYLDHCDTVSLFMENCKQTQTLLTVQGSFDLSRDDNTAYLQNYESLFYEKTKKKYFCIYYFVAAASFYDEAYGMFLSNIEIDGNAVTITATVNRDELSDPTYGTAQKPIPIVHYVVPAMDNNFFDGVSDQGNKDDKSGFHGTRAQFETYITNYNTSHYLSYVKSKADLEKMFGKQPEKKKWWQF